ncbi:MAG: amino acid permease [Chloroflexi bacterium]|nr:amino acid permease [Chloroflexota bacterium]
MKTRNGRTLKRRVGLWSATLSGTGVIVGAGIYALIGEASGLAGNAAWLGFLLAAVVAALTAISYARMGRRIPKDSPEFQYARVGLGLRSGFVAGWLMVWADIASAAAVALGFGGYLHALVGTPAMLAAFGLLVVLSLVAWFGILESILLVSLLSLVEIGGLLLVVAVGIPHWGEQPLLEASGGPLGVWSAAALVFFAYLGFDELGNLAEEMRRPERDLPAAITMAVVISTILYVLVAVSAVSLVGWQALAASSAPLASAVEAALGPQGKSALAIIALGATANTVLLLLVSASRSLFGMARAGALPQPLGWIGIRHTPWVSVALAGVVGSLFLALGDIARVAQITNFTTLTAFGMVNLSLAVVLRKESKVGGVRRPLVGVVTLLQPLLAFFTCVWLLVMTGWVAAAFGALLGITGFAVGGWVEHYQRRKQRGAASSGS